MNKITSLRSLLALAMMAVLSGETNAVIIIKNPDILMTGPNRSTAVGSGSNVGEGATAIGDRADASGDQAIAVGSDTVASGASSIAIGGDYLNNASRTNINSNVLAGTINTGEVNIRFKGIAGIDLVDLTNLYPKTTASGAASVAVGTQAVAQGHLSTALGTKTEATGLAATALGVAAKANGEGSFAAGPNAQANASKSIGNWC